jgi:hypothetical protein
MTFFGITPNTPKYQLFQKLRTSFPTFQDLLGINEQILIEKYNINIPEVRTLLLTSLQSWGASSGIAGN